MYRPSLSYNQQICLVFMMQIRQFMKQISSCKSFFLWKLLIEAPIIWISKSFHSSISNPINICIRKDVFILQKFIQWFFFSLYFKVNVQIHISINNLIPDNISHQSIKRSIAIFMIFKGSLKQTITFREIFLLFKINRYINQMVQRESQKSYVDSEQASLKTASSTKKIDKPQMPNNDKKIHQFINVCKKSCLLLLFCVPILLAFNLIVASKKQSTLNELNDDRLIIFKYDGQGILMDYRKPDLIKAPLLPEIPMKKIRFQVNYSITKYSNLLNQADSYNVKLYNDGWMQSKRQIFQAEFYTLNRTYSMNQYVAEKSICVVSWVGEIIDNITIQRLNMFLLSINEQNYSNYKIYIVDDTQQNQELEKNLTHIILEKAQHYNRLLNRLWIVKNKSKMGKLGSRDMVIRNYCKAQSIVIDILSLDNLVGKQVFNLVNRLYSKNESTWAIFGNSNKIDQKKFKKMSRDNFHYLNQISPGTNIIQNKKVILNATQYKDSDLGVSDFFKTYLRQVYMKISMVHLLEWMKFKYRQYASDYFVTYSIVQLCGEPHTFLIPQKLLVHFQEEPNRIYQGKVCGQEFFNLNKYQSKITKPYKILQSLQSPSSLLKSPSTIMSDKNRRNYIQYEKQYKLCLSKQQKLDLMFDQY